MPRKGISTYLEVFILVGVVLSGGALIFGVVSTYSNESQGPAIGVSDLTIRQGSGFAIERFVVSNLGNLAAPSVFEVTSGVSAGTSYCYTASDAATMNVLSSTCPTMSSLTSVVVIPVQVRPGASVLAEIILSGPAFGSGSRVTVVVGTSNGAQTSLSALVVPA